MSPSRTFIFRPIATSLLMLGILLAGAVAYLKLPVSALPEVDYPTIQVVTFYPGASPDVMASSVTAPLDALVVPAFCTDGPCRTHRKEVDVCATRDRGAEFYMLDLGSVARRATLPLWFS